MSLSNYLEAAVLDHVFGNTALTQPTAWYVKLHISDPGEDGTSGAAAETTRKNVTDWNAATSGAGTITSNVAISWTNYPSTETITHISIWDHVSAGNCLGSGTVTPNVSMVGPGSNTLTISSGSITVTLG